MISLGASKDPTGKLSPEPWLTDITTTSVMDALCAGGADVRFVGGCVRDAIIKRPVSDIDIGTPEPPEQVTDRLKAADIKVIPTGIEHGTITAVSHGKAFEITTLRCDLETDGRRAVIAYTDDWIVDSSRRDFTFNALSANCDGDVFDYHDGLADLAHGRVRFVGRADDRVEEDYLRILRFFRFFAHYGRHPYNSAAFNACRKHAAHLSRISAERVSHEILKTLIASDPTDTFTMMRDAHVLEHVLPEATAFGTLRAASWLAARGIVIDGLKPDPIRRLGAVIAPGSDIRSIAKKLKLSNRERKRLVAMTALAPALSTLSDTQTTHKLIHEFGNEAVADAGILAWAARLAEHGRLNPDETAARRAQLETSSAWTPPTFPIGGDDARALGIAPGPDIGIALRSVEDWWSDGDFQADREGCLGYLCDVVNKKPGEQQ